MDKRGIQKPITPFRRSLRGYAFDPQLSVQFETFSYSEVTYSIPWEKNLGLGPSGEYIEVVDFDPASKCFYQPVDPNDPDFLAQDGLAPSEANPQFHQQMVYAVAMTTIEHFERALGRRVLWSPDMKGPVDTEYVQKLRIYPHALRQPNAYYDPQRKALLFGYFPAIDSQPGKVYPGTVFSCLSQDIVAHETTHAILDGMHRSLLIPSNPDTLAFHEAFADIIALFQHFSIPGVLQSQIAKSRGDLRSHHHLLGELAVQFGMATGHYGALRSAIGHVDPTTGWTPIVPDPTELLNTMKPHDRGSILVAAVFDAFLKIYERRTADLFRIASYVCGQNSAQYLHPDLVSRLAGEAAKTARHIMELCIRALDFCPPVDLNFGDYLRALITADVQQVPKDEWGYRVAIVEAFRMRGIYPKGLRSLSVDTLLWEHPEPIVNKILSPRLNVLRRWANQYVYLDSRNASEPRRKIFERLIEWRIAIHKSIKSIFSSLNNNDCNALAKALGIDLSLNDKFEIRSLQFTHKISPDGRSYPQALISIIQENKANPSDKNSKFYGGCTVVIDLYSGEIDYVIRKNVKSQARLQAIKEFNSSKRQSLHDLYFSQHTDTCQIALIHQQDQEF